MQIACTLADSFLYRLIPLITITARRLVKGTPVAQATVRSHPVLFQVQLIIIL